MESMPPHSDSMGLRSRTQFPPQPVPKQNQILESSSELAPVHILCIVQVEEQRGCRRHLAVLADELDALAAQPGGAAFTSQERRIELLHGTPLGLQCNLEFIRNRTKM